MGVYHKRGKNGWMTTQEPERGYLLIQDYLEEITEFRVIKIGEYWFGHRKLPDRFGYRSGSGEHDYKTPPQEIFDFCLALASRLSFHIMSFDIFVFEDEKIVVNELQTWFGSYSDVQMKVNGSPGAYKREGASWVFFPGVYNVLAGVPLRISEIIRYHFQTTRSP
jgi:hypothetical protein